MATGKQGSARPTGSRRLRGAQTPGSRSFAVGTGRALAADKRSGPRGVPATRRHRSNDTGESRALFCRLIATDAADPRRITHGTAMPRSGVVVRRRSAWATRHGPHPEPISRSRKRLWRWRCPRPQSNATGLPRRPGRTIACQRPALVRFLHLCIGGSPGAPGAGLPVHRRGKSCFRRVCSRCRCRLESSERQPGIVSVTSWFVRQWRIEGDSADCASNPIYPLRCHAENRSPSRRRPDEPPPGDDGVAAAERLFAPRSAREEKTARERALRRRQ
jgi:hypothetical protein